MNLLTDREYEIANGGWTVFQAILAGGTATLSCSNAGSAASSVKVLPEGFTDVKLPSFGKYKVVLTGSATVTIEGK
jgi:hypothetical protein